MPATITTSNEFRLRSWVGDTDQLLKLARICDDLVDTAMLPIAAKMDLQDRSQFDLDYDFYDRAKRTKLWRQRIAEQKSEIRGALSPTLTITQKKYDKETTGEPEGVIAGLDLDDRVVRILLTLGNTSGHMSGGYSVRIRMTSEFGCQVSISSPDGDWTTVASDRLLGALRPRNPGYTVLRSMWAAWLIVMVSATMWIFAPVISRFRAGMQISLNVDWSNVDLAGSLASGALVGVIETAAAFGLWSVLKALLPALELLEKGQDSRGRRAVSIAIAGALWIAGIVVPLVISTTAP